MNEKKSENNQEIDNEAPVVQTFEEMFDNLGGGYTLMIYRESPRDLRGFLEEIPLDAGDIALDMQYLTKRWGGEVLKLLLRNPQGKFCRRMLVELRSFPPMRDYKPVHDIGAAPEKNDKMEFFNMLSAVKTAFPPPPPQESPWKDIIPLIIPIVGAFAKKILEPPLPPVHVPTQAQNLTEVVGALNMMKDFVQPPQEGGDITGPLLGFGEKLLGAFTASQQQKAQPAHVPVIAAQSQSTSMPTQTPTRTPTQTPAPMQIQEPSEAQLMAFAQTKLASLNGADLTKLYLDTVRMMPQDEGERAIAVLDEELGVDEDEQQEETAPTQVSGGKPRANKGDVKNNRAGNS
jgi:hypothetical protein